MNTRVQSSMFVVVTFFLYGCGRTPDASQGGSSALNKHDQSEAEDAQIYSVANYDTERIPGEDLTATINAASTSGKRILLEIGGRW